MRKFSVAALVLLALAVALLAGCGGGGGSSSSGGGGNNGGGTTTNRLITGTVVSSTDNTTGVPGVVVRFNNSIYATTGADGKFTLEIPASTTDMPFYYQVDTTGAGSTYPTTELVTLSDGQTYEQDKVDMPIGILNGTTNSLGTIIARKVTDSDLPGSPYDSHDTVLYGRIIKYSDGSGISGVTVNFGTSTTVTTKTGAKGYFALNLGRNVLPITMFSDPANATFSMDSSTAGSSYPNTMSVYYLSDNFDQDAIRVPPEVIYNGSTDLNILDIVDNGTGGGVNPPAPPTLP